MIETTDIFRELYHDVVTAAAPDVAVPPTKLPRQTEARATVKNAAKEIEVITEISRLQSLADEWKRLASLPAHPLLQHDWYLAGAQAFSPPGSLRVFTARTEGRLSAVAPLVEVPYRFGNRLEILGASLLCEPTGFLYESVDALRSLLDALLDVRMPLVLNRIPFPSPEERLLRRLGTSRLFAAHRSRSASPWIPINSDWTTYEKTISASRRSSLRRARRHAESYGKVTIECLTPQTGDLQACLDELFRVESAGWKGREGTSILSNPPLKRFFELYARSCVGAGKLRYGVMRIDGNAVAAQLSLEYARRLWVLKIGYDEAYARCSPGTLLLHETIRDAFDRGLEAYELLGSDEPWLHIWTDRTHLYESLWLYPPVPRSVLHLADDLKTFALSRMNGGTRSARRGNY